MSVSVSENNPRPLRQKQLFLGSDRGQPGKKLKPNFPAERRGPQPILTESQVRQIPELQYDALFRQRFLALRLKCIEPMDPELDPLLRVATALKEPLSVIATSEAGLTLVGTSALAHPGDFIKCYQVYGLPRDMVMSPDGQHVFVVSGSVFIDTNLLRLRHTSTFFRHSMDAVKMTMKPDNWQIFTVADHMGTLFQLDRRTDRRSRPFIVRDSPYCRGQLTTGLQWIGEHTMATSQYHNGDIYISDLRYPSRRPVHIIRTAAISSSRLPTSHAGIEHMVCQNNGVIWAVHRDKTITGCLPDADSPTYRFRTPPQNAHFPSRISISDEYNLLACGGSDLLVFNLPSLRSHYVPTPLFTRGFRLLDESEWVIGLEWNQCTNELLTITDDQMCKVWRKNDNKLLGPYDAYGVESIPIESVDPIQYNT